MKTDVDELSTQTVLKPPECQATKLTSDPSFAEMCFPPGHYMMLTQITVKRAAWAQNIQNGQRGFFFSIGPLQVHQQEVTRALQNILNKKHGQMESYFKMTILFQLIMGDRSSLAPASSSG